MKFKREKRTAKPWPKHKARPITRLADGEHTGWSIYRDQLPAIVEAMAKGLLKERERWLKYRDVKTIEEQASNHARACLRAIGVEEAP